MQEKRYPVSRNAEELVALYLEDKLLNGDFTSLIAPRKAVPGSENEIRYIEIDDIVSGIPVEEAWTEISQVQEQQGYNWAETPGGLRDTVFRSDYLKAYEDRNRQKYIGLDPGSVPEKVLNWHASTDWITSYRED